MPPGEQKDRDLVRQCVVIDRKFVETSEKPRRLGFADSASPFALKNHVADFKPPVDWDNGALVLELHEVQSRIGASVLLVVKAPASDD